ncbi:uncharacterized protein LOC132755462 [Ruditapes philippinarum]|uniref:uncharacterized protein LOC132755462 n=1 Tax=Ruditapes philippinarum TaxID=129788 RepID=UPI00295C2710|nr:uncharacterized protein LOC132755462 [Ruditapes philippinarum]
MMDSLLKEGGFWNWLKSHLAMVLTKRGIESTLEDDLNNFIQTVLTEHKINKSSICNSCTTELILSCPTKNFCVKGRQNRCVSHRSTIQGEVPGRNCAKDICHHIRDEIRKQHRQIPNWKSTDATRWGTDLVEIAKCFVPPTDRYRNAKSLKDVDFNGFLSILICKKSFGRTMPNLLSEKVNKVTKVRDMGNDIRHSGDLIVSRTNLESYIDSLISLLSDAECLAHNEAAQEAVKQLYLLKKNEVTVPVEHLNEALENAGEEIDQHLNKKDAESTTGNKSERQNKEDADANTT